MTEIRYFSENDLSSVLDLLNRNLDYDKLSETLLLEKLFLDPSWSPDLCLVAFLEGRLIGFIQGVTRDIRGVKLGYVKLLAVDATERRKGLGTRLFGELETRFVKLGMDVIRAFDVPLNYFMPGIDPRYTPALCFFERIGFSRFGDTSNLIVDLLNQSFDTAEEEKNLYARGIQVERAAETDRKELLELVELEWKLWINEVEMAFRSTPVAIHIARMNGMIKAFSAYDGNNAGTGWFGPMGTHADLRGKGIGGVLLKRCLLDIRMSGLTRAIIPWVGPISFYAGQVNASVDRVFWRYQKKLNPTVTL